MVILFRTRCAGNERVTNYCGITFRSGRLFNIETGKEVGWVKRERERRRDRQTDRDTDTDRQRQRWRQRQTETEAERERERERESQFYRMY